ncbi:MAG TPA: ATP-binding protein [Spirochaetota bacterium]|nr:Cache 3/Cache 2 fusion domain-containing protein [Spirochaetota bacterium]HOD15267.1 ATP-binding protein [Spirochaetota bacterium]HPG51280.1 ATP-binding protein [Spirochaetota bacterium]HPN13364.1 ATP-binding protein [Spirochaetota bacterium]
MNLQRLKWIILLVFVTISTVPLLCLGIIFYIKGQTLIRENVASHFTTIINGNSHVINRFINEREADMRLMGKVVLEDKYNYNSVYNRLQRIMEAYGVYRAIIIYGNQGDLLFRIESKKDSIDNNMPDLNNTAAHNINDCILPCSSRSYEGNCIALSMPITDKSNTPLYRMIGIIDFSTINDHLNNVSFGETGYLTLTDKEGRVINHKTGRSRLRAVSISDKVKLLKQGELISGEYIDEKGNRYFQATKSINRYGWLLTVKQNTDEILSRVNTLRLYLLLFIVASFVITGGIGYVAANMLIKMLQKSYDHEKELEMMILQNEKLSSMGVITSGIAHELNNPLANALIYTQLLHEKLREQYPSDDLSSMSIAVEELTRCGSIIKNLMSFSRRSSLELQEVDINDVLKGLVKMTEKYFRENGISVSVNFQEVLPKALCNESIVHQAIMNMFTNAVEAMKGGGTLKIKTWFTPITNMVKIDIRDSGAGIPQSIIGKIFDPFFSTKPSGERTGLGLYISYEMIRKAGGNIRVISSAVEDGEVSGIHTGTTFTIELPVVKQEG